MVAVSVFSVGLSFAPTVVKELDVEIQTRNLSKTNGPLTLATDMMVWNVTDKQVVVREAITTENDAPTGTTAAYRKAEREPPTVAADWISDDINAGKWDGYQPPPLPKR